MDIFSGAPSQFILGAVKKFLPHALVHLWMVHVGSYARGVQGLMRMSRWRNTKQNDGGNDCHSGNRQYYVHKGFATHPFLYSNYQIKNDVYLSWGRRCGIFVSESP